MITLIESRNKILENHQRDPLLSFNRGSGSKIERWWWTVDRVAIVCILTLIFFGFFVISSISMLISDKTGLNELRFLSRQLVFTLSSIFLMIGMSFIEYNVMRRIVLVLTPLVLLVVIITSFVGIEVKGARRWIRILGFSLQPSEFLKPCFAVFSAWLISIGYESGEKKKYYIISFIFCAICSMALLMQPDIGMTTIICFTWCLQLFLSGIPIRYMISVLCGFCLIAIIILSSFEHARIRLVDFMSGSSAKSYQIEKSLEAFAAGKWFGVGPGEGIIKNRLPDAHTDFIFAVIGEEFGSIRCLMLIMFFLLLFGRFYGRITLEKRFFCFLASSGILAQISFQTFANMAVSVRMLPTKGMTLPFFSSGGSSLLSSGFAVGLLLSFGRRYFVVKSHE